jgi:hypothetical protein
MHLLFLCSECTLGSGEILWDGPVFPSLARCFGAAKAGHFGHQPNIPKPLCSYFSSVQKATLGTGEILWEVSVFPSLAGCFGKAKAGHFCHQPKISKPLFYFSSVQKSGTGEIL